MDTCRSKTILVVDDDLAVRRLTTTILEEQGFSVIEANSGSQGLERFAEHDKKVDLVLSDIRMPNMSGTEMIERILSLEPSLPVMLMTGYSSDSPVPEGVPVLRKPFTPDLVVKAVRGCLAS